MRWLCRGTIVALCLMLSVTSVVRAEDSAVERGWTLLRTKPYLPPDFDREVFSELWKVWPEPERTRAANASLPERRRMTMSRYGLMQAPDGDDQSAPLGYVDVPDKGFVMNCLGLQIVRSHHTCFVTQL